MTQNDDKVGIQEFSENQEVAGSESLVMTPSDSKESLAARVAELEEQVTSLRNDYLRALADAQNTQARADRRIEQNTKYAVAKFVKDLITVADNLGRTLQHILPDTCNSNELLKSLATGVEMTEKMLLTLMESNGLRKLTSINQQFDPNFHQAVQEVENNTIPSGTVVSVLQEGYILHDRLVRPAMVVISRGGLKRQEPFSQELKEAQQSEDWTPIQDVTTENQSDGLTQ